MNILHVETVAKTSSGSKTAAVKSAREVIANAVGIGRPGAIAATEPFDYRGEVRVDYWFRPLFGLDPEYVAAYLKAHLRGYQLINVWFREAGSDEPNAAFGSNPKPTEAELLMLLRVVENRLSPENLSADGERPRREVLALEQQFQQERSLLIDLFGREPTFDELYPDL